MHIFCVFFLTNVALEVETCRRLLLIKAILKIVFFVSLLFAFIVVLIILFRCLIKINYIIILLPTRIPLLSSLLKFKNKNFGTFFVTVSRAICPAYVIIH